MKRVSGVKRKPAKKLPDKGKKAVKTGKSRSRSAKPKPTKKVKPKPKVKAKTKKVKAKKPAAEKTTKAKDDEKVSLLFKSKSLKNNKHWNIKIDGTKTVSTWGRLG